jgi:hypothetical protein
MHNQGDDQGAAVLARPQQDRPQPVARQHWSAGAAGSLVHQGQRRPGGTADSRAFVSTSWFALRLTLIELLRRSYFAVADPWLSCGSFDLPGGGFLRWQWQDEVAAPVHIEIHPGHPGPAGVDADELIERLVMIGWNKPAHPSTLCWLEAPRPEMWLRPEQRQRFADTADRIILTLTVVLGLTPTDIVAAGLVPRPD